MSTKTTGSNPNTIENAYLGIEFGSTRIKACLTSADGRVLAIGIHDWENKLVDGHWSYSLDEVRTGLAGSYNDLANHVELEYGSRPAGFAGIGVSAMMHGLIALDKQDELLVPFRTWRDTYTGEAAAELTELLQQNMPLRWSTSHLYQGILDGEDYIASLGSFTTLAGWVHFQLTGEKVLGVGDASGMFPIDSATVDYDADRLAKADELFAKKTQIAPLKTLLPRVLKAGENAGHLTEAGARLLDPTGTLKPGVPLCPPEGDAGTGMVATNAVRQRTGNVSAGTSIFSMAVLEHPLSHLHTEIDLVTTPSGDPVAMVHCNNGASELGVWVDMLAEVAEAFGVTLSSKDEAYKTVLGQAFKAAPDAGGVLACGFVSGEPVVGAADGRPIVARAPEARLTLPNLVRAQLYSVFAALASGSKILEDEGVGIDFMNGHGGIFKTEGVAQQVLADALETPIRVSDSAGEGGAWGIALLAAYLDAEPGESLPDFLDKKIFAQTSVTTALPDAAGAAGFKDFLERFTAALPIQDTAAATIAS